MARRFEGEQQRPAEFEGRFRRRKERAEGELKQTVDKRGDLKCTKRRKCHNLTASRMDVPYPTETLENPLKVRENTG